MRGWLATWGAPLPARRRGRLVDDGARLGGRRALPPTVQARLARAETRLAVVADADRRRSRRSNRRRCARGARERGAPARAAERRGDDERLGPARRGVGVARSSAIGGRSAGCSDLRPRRMTAGTPARARASVARAMSGCRRSVFSWPGTGCAGNRRARSRAWYRARFGTGTRARRIGIVAVARKLLIALWRYVTTGVVPTGAILKSA